MKANEHYRFILLNRMTSMTFVFSRADERGGRQKTARSPSSSSGTQQQQLRKRQEPSAATPTKGVEDF